MDNKFIISIVLIGVIITAGCTTSLRGDTGSSQAEPGTPSSSSYIHFDNTTTDCGSEPSLSFYKASEKSEWDQDSVKVGGYLASNKEHLLVVFANGNESGSKNIHYPNNSIHFDGVEIQMDKKFTSGHWVRVVLFVDSNENQQFDAGIDVACQYDGEIVQTDPLWIDFGTIG